MKIFYKPSLMRYLWGCLVLCSLMTGCAVGEQKEVRHYSGVVLDAETRLPVPNTTVKAMKGVFGLFTINSDIELGRTTTRKDGRFDFVFSGPGEIVHYFQAEVPIPYKSSRHMDYGSLDNYDGLSNDVSTRRPNIILVYKHYVH